MDDLLESAISLYVPAGHIELDATYSKGGFYKSGRIKKPTMRFDLHPQSLDVRQADCRNLPLPAMSINSSIIDLPFNHAPGKNSIMGKRFSGFRTQKELRQAYMLAIIEQRRILAKGGVFLMKCMDCVESGKQTWNHIYAHQYAKAQGMHALDLMVLITGHRPIGHNCGIQRHARKFHSYVWCFKL